MSPFFRLLPWRRSRPRTAAKKPTSFDSALAGYRQGEREELPILADPANIPRDQAVGNEHGGPR